MIRIRGKMSKLAQRKSGFAEGTRSVMSMLAKSASGETKRAIPLLYKLQESLRLGESCWPDGYVKEMSYRYEVSKLNQTEGISK